MSENNASCEPDNAQLEITTIVLNGVKYVISDPARLPPDELYKMASAMEGIRIVGPWEDGKGDWIRRVPGREHVQLYYLENNDVWVMLSEGRREFKAASLHEAKIAVDAHLCKLPNTVVVDPIKE